ncbi:hypothetical protein M5D96_002878 [Drosophila gunungcola]|uniref:Uncharacterized protein n=1 Tax=Drosophila gunungcola TaxID=103775 RepID=A0A9P9Z158_9MUSC|nr:hypothetical protein M5D96_002878 [Drosophila gunungcola]
MYMYVNPNYVLVGVWPLLRWMWSLWRWLWSMLWSLRRMWPLLWSLRRMWTLLWRHQQFLRLRSLLLIEITGKPTGQLEAAM